MLQNLQSLADSGLSYVHFLCDLAFDDSLSGSQSAREYFVPKVPREALAQILDNLVDNALKYTPDGSRIRVRWYGQGEQICIEVEDNGPGIPEEDVPRIFERFYRVDKARSRAEAAQGAMSGAGLGLSIARWIAEAHGGRVWLETSDSSGSVFVATLARS